MARMLDLARSWKYFAAFFALALVAFWPSYLSRPGTVSPYTHLHAATAALWMLLLVAQSWAIGARRVGQHRLFGKLSYALAPVLLVSILLLAHSRIQGMAGGPAYALQTYILYLQVSLAVLFGLVGFAAFRYGKKNGEPKPLFLGIALMAYGYFVSNVWISLAIGSALTLLLFFPR